MKQFIYFDKNKIESLVAQSYGGIDESVQISHEQVRTDESEKSNSIRAGFEGGLNALLKKLKLSVTGEYTNVKTNSVDDLFGEIHTKILHDSIFDILVSELKSTNKLNPSEKKAGSFIKDEDDLQIIDFEYIESFFKESSVVSILKERQQKEIREAAEKKLEEIPNDKMYNQQKQKIEAQIKEEVNKKNYETDKLFKDTEKLIGATKVILPYNRMALSSKGFLMPLEEKCFRDNPNLLGLKYGGSFHYIGYITNIIEPNTKTKSSENAFSGLQKMANEFLLKVLPTDTNKIYVLHPLGIYFES